MVHHIHAFTIHCTLLILLKGVLYARSSRLVADKWDLGFRYPCDGPGRGGTCQISPWDHVYLGVFWMYNAISVVIFHFFWKMQSDVWGTYDANTGRIDHISGGDWSVNAGTVNGWLRNFLWSQSAQVIQSYGTQLCEYGLVFLLSHFVWAFSLNVPLVRTRLLARADRKHRMGSSKAQDRTSNPTSRSFNLTWSCSGSHSLHPWWHRRNQHLLPCQINHYCYFLITLGSGSSFNMLVLLTRTCIRVRARIRTHVYA